MGHMANYPVPQPSDGPDYHEDFRFWRKMRNTCDKCKTDAYAEVRNFDRMWGDGDLWCTKCDTLIRIIDTG